MQGASSVEEAVSQYHDDPNHFSRESTAADMISDKTAGASNALPNYLRLASTQHPPDYHRFGNASQLPVHSNALIEAGNLRARDEVSVGRG